MAPNIKAWSEEHVQKDVTVGMIAMISPHRTKNESPLCSSRSGHSTLDKIKIYGISAHRTCNWVVAE